MESKNFAASRRVQALASMGGAFAVQALGIPVDSEYAEIVQNGLSGLLAVFTLVRFIMHFVSPDGRKLVLGRGASALLLCALIGSSPISIGCATNQKGEEVVTKEGCKEYVAQAEALKAGCVASKTPEALVLCVDVADAILKAANAACNLGDDVPPPPPE